MAKFLDTLDFRLVGPTSKRVVLDAPLRFEDDNITYTIPKGFSNDLASVPLWLRSLAPPWQQSARPGVLHDYFYRRGGYFLDEVIVPMSRLQADKIFQVALKSEGVSNFRARVMYRAVRWFAGGAWENYRLGGKETK